MTPPHLFPSLIDGPVQAVVIVGTGLSTPDAPTVDALKVNLDFIANTIGVPANKDFFDLAEGVLKHLVATGKSDPESRIWLADKLGMLDDRKWFGEIGLPISGNTPRHRALARFAVEKRIRAIVSLNWDALLESALESIGVGEGRRPVRPWDITTHARVVDDAHLPALAAPHVFPVIKPHGCVRNLEAARRYMVATGIFEPVTFKLTKSELKQILGGQGLVDKKVQGFVAECPVIALGWKATEPYLRDTVVSTAVATKRTEADAFTLISRSWYPNAKAPAETYHDDIATAYGRQRDDSFLPVGNNGDPTMDCVLKWLYCRYSITRVAATASPLAKIGLQQLLMDLAKPDFNHVVTNWADQWFPLKRLLWSAVLKGDSWPKVTLVLCAR